MNLSHVALTSAALAGVAVGGGCEQLSITPMLPGEFQLSWRAENLRPYQIETAPDLFAWRDCGPSVVGTGIVENLLITCTEPQRFFRLRKGAVRTGFEEFVLPANDDGSTDEVLLGFPIRIFPTEENPGPWENCFVNNNGNITIGTPAIDFTPLPLQNSAQEIPGLVALFAPFWADVDTDGAPDEESGAKEVSYGHGVVNGHPAFGVNWVNVGYYINQVEKLNSFQMVLISRSDTEQEGQQPGNFDVEFNYNRVLWETGSHFTSGGVNGYGGFPARCGISNGADQTVELTYSGQTLLQLDSDPTDGSPNHGTGLIYRSRNSTVPGRFIFQVRDGNVLGSLEVHAGADVTLLPEETTVNLAGTANDPSGGTLAFQWSILSGSSNVTFSDQTILDPVVTIPVDESAILQLTATSTTDPNIGAADIMEIKR
jgi:hypothetical protein